MSGYHILATHDLLAPAPASPPSFLRRVAPAVTGGLLGAAVGGAHPVLGALFGSALVKNAVDVASGERTLPEAASHLRSHAVAAGCSLAVPAFPLIGYCAGVVADSAIFGASWKPAPSYADVRAGSATLHEGQEGPAVGMLQRTLNVDIDDKFGPKTAAAVRAFKQRHPDMYSDDVVGKATLVAMEEAAKRGERFAPVPSTAPSRQTEPSSASNIQVETTPSAAAPAAALATATTSTKDRFLTFAQGPVVPGSRIKVWHVGLAGTALALVAGGLALRGRGPTLGDLA